MSDLSPDLAELIAAERERPAPPSAATARLLSRLDGTIAALGPGQGSLSSIRAALSKPLVIAGLGALLGAGVGGAVDRAVSSPRTIHVDPVVSHSDTVSPPAVAAPVPTEAETKTEIERPAPTATPEVRATHPTQAASASRERRLIEVARATLSRGEALDALATIEQHARQFPHGQLVEEREALAVQCLARLGRMADARARARRFRQQHPGSLFAPAIEAAIGPL